MILGVAQVLKLMGVYILDFFTCRCAGMHA
jgi:hypothetical protein